MARPPSSPLTLPALSPEGDAVLAPAIAARQEFDVRQAAAARMAQYQDVLISVGTIRAAQFNTTLNESLIAQVFSRIRQDRSFQGLPYQDATGQARTCETLEEFCAHYLGKSYDRCRQLADTLHVLGPDLYDQAQTLGFKSRDYRALKALPADDQQAVREALEEGDKDTALAVLSTLVGRQQEARKAAERQRDAARQAQEETQANYDAATALIGERETEIRRLKAGDIPPPAMDARMANWGPAVRYLIGETMKPLRQLVLLIHEVSELDVPTEPRERAAFQQVLTLVGEAADPGLAEVADLVAGLQRQVDIGLSGKMFPQE